MCISKPWDWSKSEKAYWLTPSEESYYLAARWQGQGRRALLDLGCGLGRHAVFFAKQGFAVSATDLSAEGIAHLQRWAAQEGLQIPTQQADMLRLPYTDAAFDCVLSYHVLSHTDTAGIRQTLAELRRVLKPGGECFLTLCSKETWSFAEAGFPRLDANTVIKRDSGPEDGVPHFFVSLADIPSLLQGFTLLQVRHIDDCWFDGKAQNSKHYYILAVKDKQA